MHNKLKKKILSINYLSIILVVIVFSVLSFFSVYSVLNMSFQKDIEFTKEEYIKNKKLAIKNQVENLINYIKYISEEEKKRVFSKLQKDTEVLHKFLLITPESKLKHFIQNYQKTHKNYLIYIKKGNKVLYESKGFPELSLKDKGLKTYMTQKGVYYTYLYDNSPYKIALAINEEDINKKIQKKIINFIHSLDFVFHNGYISVLKIINFNGGKKFAKFVAYPKNPEWEGLYLNDNKKDAKGVEYRKEYLKLLVEKGEGFFVYWFKKDGKLYKKISYVKLYKPFNWAVFGGIYIDEVDNIINQKKEKLQSELKQIFKYYIFISVLFVIIVVVIANYENKLLKKVIEEYEDEISQKNKELKELNKKLQKFNENLQKEVEKKTQALLKSYFTDRLTHLPNREKFLHDIKKSENCIAILNIDSFKEINDYYGTEFGDLVLKKVGEILSQFSYAYKLSGDEFGILGNNCEKLASRVSKIISQIEQNPIVLNSEPINISITAGVGKTLEQADLALKHAKVTKIDKVVIYNENLSEIKEYKEFLKWKKILKEAIENDGIIPYVQPIVDAKTKEIKKYETLMRIKYQGKIYPPFFLKYAKKAGLYVDLQKIMIDKTFEKFSTLKKNFSINLSVVELANINFRKYLIQKIDQYDVSDFLTIELLESENLTDDEIKGFLIYLREMMGVEIAIDDFGSGNSNVAYLVQEMPVSILKIDGILIKDVLKDENKQKLIKVIVDMAKIFKLKTIAEFVENDEMAEFLEQYGVDCLQGYFFSPPFDIEELRKDKK